MLAFDKLCLATFSKVYLNKAKKYAKETGKN